MKVALVDYDAGNLHSAHLSLTRAFDENHLHGSVEITADPEKIRRADAIVLPGDGAFAPSFKTLSETPDLLDALTEAVLEKKRPFLGVCVGMQLLADHGSEGGPTKGLGWIKGRVVPLMLNDPALRTPHMGWNDLALTRADHPVVDAGCESLHAYFLHSFHFVNDNPETALATTDHGGPILAAVGRENIVGVQFHPEKSQTLGRRIFSNFLRWKP